MRTLLHTYVYVYVCTYISATKVFDHLGMPAICVKPWRGKRAKLLKSTWFRSCRHQLPMLCRCWSTARAVKLKRSKCSDAIPNGSHADPMRNAHAY